MEQINDLQPWLEETIDLSDSINLTLKVSKLREKILCDLVTNKKNLSMRPKMIISLEKNKTSNFDAIYFSEHEKIIDLHSEDKKNSLKKKVATTIFKIKNFELPKIQKKDFVTAQEVKDEIEEKEDKKEEIFVEKFIEKNTKKWFQVYPLYKIKQKINYFKIFVILLFIVFLWILDKTIIEVLVKTSYSNLILLKDWLWDLEKTKDIVNSSKSRLFFAKVLFFPVSFLPFETIKNVNHIIDWWKNISNLILETIDLYENIDSEVKKAGWPNNLYLTNIFEKLKNNYSEINNLLVNTYVEYNKITDLWDKSLNQKLSQVKDKINETLIILDKINKNYDTLLSILWEYKPRRYLVVFQNNDEIRASWGFAWSMAFIDVERWKVTNIEKKDVYALEWSINQVYPAKDKEKAPEWLNKVTQTFGLRDANYFPEIKDSANKIKFFLDKIDQQVDWIIFINQNLVLDLLKSIDWLYSNTFQTEIKEENFSIMISTLVEAEVFREWTLWTPKQALFLFAEELAERLNSEKKYYDYLKIISKHIKNRDIVFYSFHPVENSLLWKLWLNWEINFRETLDFDYPVYTSIWWNKSDRYIDYRYEKTVKKVENSCDFETNLKIFNTHTYSSENETYVNQILDKYNKLWKNINDIINIQWRWDNKSYLRVLVPKNAEVKLKEWQKLKEDENYKIIELYTETKAWQTSSYDVEYKLKNKSCMPYSYKFFKQPWIRDFQILFNVFGKQSNYNDIESDFIYKD